MKSRIAIGLIVFVASLHGAIAQTSAGRTPGQYVVSPTGGANYSIPIWTPPGPRGIQPSLGIAYSSQSGTGMLGPGWQLTGLSSITRCNLTVAQDGVAAAVMLAYSDRFCLDGQRLRLTSSETLSTYGQDSTTYQTEIANFSNVTAHGQAGFGPAYFSVQGENGLTYEYGNVNTVGAPNNSSQVIAPGTSTALQWLLDKVSDRYGNNYVITYGAPNAAAGVGLPTTISYTPSSEASTTYNYTVTFSYVTRVSQNPSTNMPAVVSVVAGSSISNPNLLNSITVSASGTTVREYTFGYTASATTTQALLTGITECGGSAGTNCLYPTSITYQAGAAGVQATATTAVSGNLIVLATRDFNGDGRDDILYLNAANNTLYVAFATATGFATPVVVAPYTGTGPPAYGDLLGKGQNDILVSVSNVWWRYSWNGSTFAGTSTGIALDTGVNYAALIDINGDGLPDLITADLSNIPSGQSLVIHSRLNTSTSGTLGFASTEAATSLPQCPANLSCYPLIDADGGLNSKLRSLDFNGDEMKDLVVHMLEQSQGRVFYTNYLLISNGTSFAVSGGTESTQAIYVYLNANDDNCTDIATGTTLSITGCNGTVGASTSLSGTVIGAIDWDGDGRDDMLVANGTTLGVIESTGTGGTAIISTSIPYSSSTPPFVFDQDGDGLGDLGFSTPAGGNITYSLHNAAAQPPDLAASFVDGYGNSARPLYMPITQGSYAPWNDQVFPNQNYLGPLYVVYQSTFSDPSTASGTYQQTFFYAGAALNLQGRGFAGFGAKQRFDSRTGIWETSEYGRVFPYTGMFTLDIQAQDNLNTEPIRIVTNTLNATTLDGTTNNQRVFPHTSNGTIQKYEVGGAENGDLITTTSTAYTFDNYGNATSIVKTVTDNDPGSPYSGQQWTTTTATTISASPSTWCNSLPTERDVTKTAPGSTITRHLSFTPDYSNCRETQQVVESGNSTYQVTTSYAFDAFGNINSQTVAGIGMAARTTSINWGTTGQFPTQVTNPLGQISYPSFDPVTGQPLSFKDPNGITTSWQYDPFGRKTKEIRPDGTYTVWSYNDCTVWGGCLYGPHALALAHFIYSTTGVDQSDGTDWFDQLDRPIIKNSVNIAGTYDRSDVRYDNLGNIAQQSMPCAYSAVLTPCTYWTTNSHDALGRLTRTQRPISATNSTLQTTMIQYAGRTTTITDPQGKVTTNIAQVTGSVGRTIDNNGYYINFNHDAWGSVLSVTDSLSNTLRTMTPYAYGIAAFETSMTDMDLGTRSYTHDALGEVTAYSDGKGQSFSAAFDALSRMTSRTEPDLTTTWTWGATAASYNIGKLASVSSTASGGTYSEAYTFDSIGRLSNETITLPTDGTPAFDYAYSPTTGLLSTLTYPPSFPSTYRLTAGYTYQHGILQQIFDSLVPTTIWWQANAMNPRGQITQETTEALSGDPQIVSNRTYDAVTGWLVSTQTGPGGGATLQNEAYLHDEMGNVTQRQNNNLGLTENFYYDNLYRLDHSTLGGNTNLQMAYDAMGDITSRSDVAAGATWTYDPARKHAVTQAGSSAFTNAYDANGNVTSRNGSIIGWTSYNYPDGVTTATESATFDYGPNRQRWRMIYSGPSGNETTFYATRKFEKVYVGGGGEYRSYIYAGSRPVVVVMRNTAGAINVRSLLVDHQGSISSIVTDSTGASLVSESFTAYGNRREASTWSGVPTSAELTTMNGVTRAGYTFQTVLGSMGLNHMNGRIEDSVTGRFLSPDPRGTMPGNTQSWNRYSYVLNNPLTLTDPTGFTSEQPPPTDGGINVGGSFTTYTGSNIPGINMGIGTCTGSCDGFNQASFGSSSASGGAAGATSPGANYQGNLGGGIEAAAAALAAGIDPNMFNGALAQSGGLNEIYSRDPSNPQAGGDSTDVTPANIAALRADPNTGLAYAESVLQYTALINPNEVALALYANEDGTYSYEFYAGDSPSHTPVYSYTDGDSLALLEHTHPVQICFMCGLTGGASQGPSIGDSLTANQYPNAYMAIWQYNYNGTHSYVYYGPTVGLPWSPPQRQGSQ
jgi:RHS repeat-associated protein